MTTVVVRGAGTVGPRGNGWLHGNGAPASSLGIDGDYYVDMAAAPSVLVFYGPKTSGAWGTGMPINSGSDPSIFNVRSYGAVGDGVTDDTAAIRSAINAAVAYGASNSQRYAEVYFPPATYLLSSAPIKGGTTHGNSVLPLPVIAPTAAKVTLRLHGLGEPSALPHWQQTSPQVSGSVLRCTYQEQMDNTYGECSVLGGPTPQQGYGTGLGTLFNNLMVVVDGIQIQTKHDHTAGYISGFDLRGVAECHIVNAGAFTDATPPTIVFPNGAGYEFGLAMPFPANNAYSLIDAFSCEGFTYGAWLSEHCVVTQIAAVYCYDGLVSIGSYESSGSVQHTLHVMYACVEACTNALLVTPTSRLLIDQLDVENISAQHVRDPSGDSVGTIGLGGIISSIEVSDPTNLAVYYIDRHPGAFTAPAIPTSGVSFRSTAWRDAAVTITGGTVTQITVDGQVTGLTSGTVIVPTGRNITLTYSVAPTWVWTLL